MQMHRLLFLSLCLFGVTSAPWCAPADVMPVRIAEVHDYVPSVLLYAGRASTQETLRLRFRGNISRAVVHIPVAHPLLAELGGGELDANPVTMPRIFTSWRQHDTLLRAAPVASMGALGFNLADDSSWWLRYDNVVFTGAELISYHRLCDGGGPVNTLVASLGDTARDVWRVGEGAPAFEVTVRRTNVSASVATVNTWANISVHVDLERAQTLLPPALLADLLAAPQRSLFVRPAGGGSESPFALLLRAEEVREDFLVAPDLTQTNATHIVIGHVLARRLFGGWAANSSGIVVAALLRSSPSGFGVSCTLLSLGVILSYLLAFWTTTLESHVRLNPPPELAAADRRRTLRHVVVLVAVGGVAHILAVAFVGTGPVLANNITTALRLFGRGFFLPGSLLHVGLVIAAGVSTYGPGERHYRKKKAWHVLVAAHCALVTRSLAIAMLPAATRSLFSVLVFAASLLMLVVGPSVYVGVIATVRTAQRSRKSRDLPVWDIALAFVTITTLVLDLSGIYKAVLWPLMTTINARFSATAMDAAAVVIAAIPVFIGTLMASFEARLAGKSPRDAV